MLHHKSPIARDLAGEFLEFVRDPTFPCVGAKSALSRDQMKIVIGRDITSAWDDLPIWNSIYKLAQSYRATPKLFQTLVIIFQEPGNLSEAEFETALWERLQSLSHKDDWLGQRPDPTVSADPDDPHFSLSFGGEAFFVVGLHPEASRPARRFSHPALVFNLHDQFVKLRELGRYEKLRESILERDLAVAGSINPMLARHGEISEARQYSGRAVGPEWRCPFSGRKAANDSDP